VPGIGLKTAARLIAEYGDLETLLARAGEIKQPGRRDALLANAEVARLSRRLVELETRAPMPVALDDLLLGWPDPDVLFPFVNAMEFGWLARRLGQLYEADPSAYPPDPAFAPARPPTTSGFETLRYRAVVPAEGGQPFSLDTPHCAVTAMPRSMAHVDAWVRYDFRQPEARKEAGEGHEGWKIHVSVDADRLADAWDAILPIVAEARLHAKVAGPAIAAKIGDAAHRQAGKTIALYAETGPDPDRWARILAAVEDALAAAGIEPGPRVAGDRPVAGSAYSQVRADRDRSGRYLTGPSAYNPLGWPDPFERISVAGARRRDAREDALRCMNFVVPGWRLEEVGMSCAFELEEDAVLTARAMSVSKLDVLHEATVLWFEELDADAISDRWHDVMEVRRAAEIGALVRASLPEGAVAFSVRPRASGDRPPEIRLRFADPDVLAWAAAALPDLLSAPGGPEAGVSGDVLAIPYAGWLHRGPTLDAAQSARIRQLIDPEAAAVQLSSTQAGPRPGMRLRSRPGCCVPPVCASSSKERTRRPGRFVPSMGGSRESRTHGGCPPGPTARPAETGRPEDRERSAVGSARSSARGPRRERHDQHFSRLRLHRPSSGGGFPRRIRDRAGEARTRPRRPRARPVPTPRRERAAGRERPRPEPVQKQSDADVLGTLRRDGRGSRLPGSA
jgi:hypothetical protein